MKSELGKLTRGLYIRLNSVGVEKDLSLVKNHGIPPSKIKDFIKWASIERTCYENDIYYEIDTYLKCKYNLTKEWIRIRKTENFFLKLVERDGYFCQNCFSIHNLTIDHITPRTLLGAHTLDNMQLLCRRCNSSKGNKLSWMENNKYKRTINYFKIVSWN